MSFDMTATTELAVKIAAAQRVFDDAKAKTDRAHALYREAADEQAIATTALADLKDLEFYDKIAWQEKAAKDINSRMSSRYPANAAGVMPLNVLHEACKHVWVDERSNLVLGLGAQKVASDDGGALHALKRHLSAVSAQEGMQVMQMLGRRVRD